MKKIKPQPKKRPLKQKKSWKRDPLNPEKKYSDRQLAYYRENQEQGAKIANKWL